jgi:hypothetical protein
MPTGLMKKIFSSRPRPPYQPPPDGVKCKILPNFTLDPVLTVCWPVLYCRA